MTRPAPVTPDPLHTLQSSAEYLDVTDRTVRNYIARGDLPAVRIRGSRAIRIRQSDLDALLRPIPTVGGDQVA